MHCLVSKEINRKSNDVKQGGPPTICQLFEICFILVACLPEADVVFLIDRSGSIGAANYELEKQFVISVVQALGGDLASGGIHVGAVVFGTTVSDPFYLRTYERDANSIINAIRSLRYTDPTAKTNMARALINMRDNQFIRANGDRPEGPNIAILITDGRNEPSDADRNLVPVDEANRAKNRQPDPIQILTVAVGSNTDLNQLRQISSNNRVFQASNFQALSSLINTLSQSVCEAAVTGI